eukprot:m.310213 g.310213  ORF g.310213 m.310213 type:complete len:259 (-) comp16374_c0_seq3:136-912(-)
MRSFSRILNRSSSNNSVSNNEQPGVTSINCTYHGWAILPSETLRSDPNTPINYNKLVEMAKRVGVAQTTKSTSRKPERATAVLTEESLRIEPKQLEEGAMPLLHASINTIICTLISKKTGVAVVVAHTWDGQGTRQIGCDVLKLKPSGCVTFKASVQAAIDAMNRRNAAARSAQQPTVVPPPYSAADPIQPPHDDEAPPPFSEVDPVAARTSMDCTDDMPIAYDDIFGTSADSGYMTISCPEYLDVAPAADDDGAIVV